MKILQVIPAFYPAHAYGGTVEVAYRISRELVRRGHEVTVYTSDSLDKYHRLKSGVSEIDGIKVYYFKTLNNRLAWNDRLIFTIGILPQLRRNINSFDVVHLHSYYTFLNIATHHYAKKHNIPYVLQAHGSVLPIFQKQRLKKFFNLFWGYRIIKDTSKVIALTKTEAEQYKKMGVDENKIEIVSNGIDMPEYDNLPNRGKFRRKYSIGDDEKIILYLGRIHKIKGIDLLVETFSDLIKELNNVRLIIAGPDDGFLSTLKGQIEDLKLGNKTLLTGPLYERDKLEAYVDADVYVLPSVYETFPVTVLEACACGTPVIVTDRCDIAEFVDGKVGYVIQNDKDQLRDVIFKVLSDEGLRGRFGEEGRRLVEEQFGWDKVVKQVEDLYLRINEIKRD
jgi:glycosyltransferase involved in cell wall biosynthesis